MSNLLREHLADAVLAGIDAVHDMDVTHDQYAWSAADAIIAALPDMVVPLQWERLGEKLHWVCMGSLSGEASFIKMYAGTDKYNLYADGFRGVGNIFDTLGEAQAAAQAHHVAQVLSAFGITPPDAGKEG